MVRCLVVNIKSMARNKRDRQRERKRDRECAYENDSQLQFVSATASAGKKCEFE